MRIPRYWAKSTETFLIEWLGDRSMDDEMSRVVKFHDQAIRVSSNLELA